jgi:hypothetical protein
MVRAVFNNKIVGAKYDLVAAVELHHNLARKDHDPIAVPENVTD